MVITVKTDHLIDPVDFLGYQKKVAEINEEILHQTGAGNDFLGWVDWKNKKKNHAVWERIDTTKVL